MTVITLFDFSDKKTRKYIMMIFYSLIGLLILYFFLRKRTPTPVVHQIPEKLKKEDRRPRLSISGSLITPETLSTVSKLGRFTRIHLVFKVKTNEEEEKITQMLTEVPNLAKHRVLFCETDVGYRAIVRQLSPKLHIEDKLDYASEMKPYLNAIAIISDKECEYFYQLLEFQDCQSKILHILTDLR